MCKSIVLVLWSSKQFTILFSYPVCRSAEAGQPLSEIVPISRNKLTPYRAVIIMRLIILGLFFHYRITNPVESAYGLWLTSIICEIWFAVSWVLDQFPKWSPINRRTYIDVLSARYPFFKYVNTVFLLYFLKFYENVWNNDYHEYWTAKALSWI